MKYCPKLGQYLYFKGGITLDRPYIICHMLSSLDGKVIGGYLETKRAAQFTYEYERIHEMYGCNAWMCGRVTMEKDFTFGHQLDLKQDNIPPIPRTDYVAKKDAKSYAIAVDPSGKLGWTESSIAPWNEHRTEEHIVEVLTEKVSDGYLEHLQNLGISYIFGGKERLNFTLVVQKLKQLFSIDKLMLEGGGVLNGSFLAEDLIDELSLLLVPIADGASNSVTLFETNASLPNQHPVNFYLKEVQKMDDDGLWLKYMTKKE